MLMDGEKIYDPLRRKEVALTPEEEVRQWFITEVLHKGMGVPMHMMMSEVALQLGEKKLRADIVVYGRAEVGKPLLVVECKRPDIVLSQEVVDQAIRYHRVLDVRYIVITSGVKTFFFERDGEGNFSFVEKAPKWEEML